LTDVGWIEYGDLGDSEFLESVSWERCRLVISTVVDFEDTVRFLKFMKNISNSSTRIVVSCSNHTEATSLYAMGAHEVIVPHDLGGEHLVGLVNKLYAS
jgi:voltage-gated potassium channel Kch